MQQKAVRPHASMRFMAGIGALVPTGARWGSPEAQIPLQWRGQDINLQKSTAPVTFHFRLLNFISNLESIVSACKTIFFIGLAFLSFSQWLLRVQSTRGQQVQTSAREEGTDHLKAGSQL